MTTHPRTAALSIIAIYWTMLVLGMASCIAVRADASIAAIWTGTVLGSVLGHALVLCNTRAWFAHASILILAAVLGPSAPGALAGATMWLAFVPAAMCAYWSLGDRTSLIAFWYPAVIWMLAILDRAQASGVPDEGGIVLLGVLALLFIVFLRVRETRRIALWSTVAVPTTKLAALRPHTLLKERPGFRFARTGWAVVASALAFGATVWVAPRLWRGESLDPEQQRLRTAEHRSAGRHAGPGLPCCPVEQEVEVPRKRVKEYFGIGRGHDEHPAEPKFTSPSCRRCVGVAEATAALEPTYSWTPGGAGTYVEGNGQYGPGSPEYAPPPPVRVRSTGGWTSGTASIETAAPAGTETTGTPSVTPDPAPVTFEPAIPHAPELGPAPPDSIDMQAEPPVAPESPMPPAEPTVAAQAPVNSATTPAPSTERERIVSPSILQWLAVVLAAALLLQLIALALRPIRRWVTLRHLREPFWQETVDQRVSNAWQLALVGLRDAGWRSDSQESPRDLARRVGIEGVDQCAAILERARHGVGIDADDLSTMTSSARAAYRAARSRLGPVARATTWLRWPLA